jgi:hypothetical protein
LKFEILIKVGKLSLVAKYQVYPCVDDVAEAKKKGLGHKWVFHIILQQITRFTPKFDTLALKRDKGMEGFSTTYDFLILRGITENDHFDR